LINPDNIPPNYGGTGPELFFPHPNTELVWVSRGGEFTKTVIVPPDRSLHVDSYVTEAAVDISISSQVYTEALESSDSDRTKRRSSIFSFGGSPSKGEVEPSRTHVNKYAIIPGDKGNLRSRYFYTLTTEQLGNSSEKGYSSKVTITYKNSRNLSQTPLVYALTVVDLVEEQAKREDQRNHMESGAKEDPG
jgi:hypothetical protein